MAAPLIVVGRQKTQISESFAGVEDASNIIRAEGAILRQSSALKHFDEKLYCGCGGPVENPAVRSSGVLAWQPS